MQQLSIQGQVRVATHQSATHNRERTVVFGKGVRAQPPAWSILLPHLANVLEDCLQHNTVADITFERMADITSMLSWVTTLDRSIGGYFLLSTGGYFLMSTGGYFLLSTGGYFLLSACGCFLQLLILQLFLQIFGRFAAD